MLSEREAWLEIAHRFSLAKLVTDPVHNLERWSASTEYLIYGFGICAVIVDLEDAGLLDKETSLKMSWRLEKYREAAEKWGLYIWSTFDKEGVQERIEFCKTQSELC